MVKKRILYVSQEITPYLPENDLSKTSRFLPQAMNESGIDVRLFMPRFGCINVCFFKNIMTRELIVTHLLTIYNQININSQYLHH